MAIAFVQTATLGAAGGVASQATSPFSVNPTIGNYLIAWAFGWASNTPANTNAVITDSNGGNTWVIPTNAGQSVLNDHWCTVAYAKVAATSASFTVTAKPPGSVTNAAICVVAAEFSGIAASSPLDGAAGVGTNGTSANSGMAPGNLTVSAGSLTVAVWVSDDGAASPHVNGVTSGQPGTAPTGFTAVGTEYAATIEVGQGAYAIGTGSPSNPAWSTSPDTAAIWGASQFALLAAGGGAAFPLLSDYGVEPASSVWNWDARYRSPQGPKFRRKSWSIQSEIKELGDFLAVLRSGRSCKRVRRSRPHKEIRLV